MLTDFIQNFLNKNIGELEDKNILISLPNKKRIELGNHQSSIEITFNSWLGIWIIFRRGALGLTEGYINNYWQTYSARYTWPYHVHPCPYHRSSWDRFCFL